MDGRAGGGGVAWLGRGYQTLQLLIRPRGVGLRLGSKATEGDGDKGANLIRNGLPAT